MPRKRVAVAMSGGVDSSLAAALLKEADYEVNGIHMQLWSEYGYDATQLEQTCSLLDIPLYKLDLQAEFQKMVISYFCQEYAAGRTPNPCVTCNRHIKFGLLLERALEMGANYLATGHYARIEPSPDGYRLLKAADTAKDQSYFLYTLGQKELKRLLLPLGSLRKTEVRKLAAERGLPTSRQHDSQDVCFIPGNDYRPFITEHIPLEPGDITDTDGNVLGKHGGLAQYTVGQRQGLGLNSSEPLYVLRLDAAGNRLVVGGEDRLLSNKLSADGLTWVSGKAPEEPVNVTAKIRYKSPAAAAELYLKNGAAGVSFRQSQRAITPGQSVVFYQGDTVLGGGIITDADTDLY
jgi:tRNA-specific 2-thiouridylase